LTPKRCGALDIVFVIDSSESVGLANFTLEKNFVINTINRLGSMAKDPNSETAKGVNTYVPTTFHRFSSDAVKRLEWIAGGTWTPSALKYAYDHLIKDSRRAKANVTVVVITDGRFDPRDDDSLLTYLCSDPSVDVSAIGIGDMFDQIEENESLKSIACQRDGRVLGMRRFADLVAEEFIDKIETVLCPDPVIVCPDLPCKTGCEYSGPHRDVSVCGLQGSRQAVLMLYNCTVSLCGLQGSRLARRNAELSFVFITDGITAGDSLEEGVSAMRRVEGIPTVIAMGTDTDQEVLRKVALGDTLAIFRGEDYATLGKPTFFERFIRWVC
uniref:VWFA domain-containing protein n=1 Tax=Hucho hucho TaxID=62062 RepID=A0A4W5MCK7_9TELE